MSHKDRLLRRQFLKQAAGVVGAATQANNWPAHAAESAPGELQNSRTQFAGGDSPADVSFPRVFRGNQLKMISFPLGGVAAGSLGLGGRGQLCNWEIFNRPNKGGSPQYVFPAIWVQSGSRKPVAHVLESRITPPYEGQSGLGSKNSPGLSRLEGAVFTGEYPLAHISFEDKTLPVTIELDAFSPFIPHESDDSGLPVAVLRYRVTNPDKVSAKVSIAFSIDNPVVATTSDHGAAAGSKLEGRRNEFRGANGLAGLIMSNPGMGQDDPMHGEFVLAVTSEPDAEISHWLGWPEGRWWNSPLLFWDQFSRSGNLDTQPEKQTAVGVLCMEQSIAPGKTAHFQFLLGWRFPNRTPEWCGWAAPPGEGKTIIGNSYAVRFKSAWDAVAYAAANLKSLEDRTRAFAEAFRKSTLPDVVKEAASANLSTLATTTCFRTADGEFHGFEGSNDSAGCCFGNCTHVWNYETSTTFLFPSFAHSLRRSAFGYSMDEAGAIHFRQMLPDGKARSGFAAADGQMGQVMHAWLDWKISGDEALLREIWPSTKKALEFAWVPGGWDGNRDGVMEGVQHNTYDVEFYGPNPMCGIYYLGGLRAGEEMARAAGDTSSADTYRSLFKRGSQWIDENLFNGDYYVQRIRGFSNNEIAHNLRSDMGSQDTLNPEYQVGAGCLVDQLVGQYLADICDLGPLVDPEKIRTTLKSIYRYNYKRSLAEHDNVERTFALNNESSLVICDYGKAARPKIPFPYFAETMTGFEYTAAVLMMNWGMVEEGLECVRNIRDRYDGEKRNPWDEAECGHHYARAMSAWSAVMALSGFSYNGAKASVIAVPLVANDNFNCIWTTGTGWGTYSINRLMDRTSFAIKVLGGTLPCESCEIAGKARTASVKLQGTAVESRASIRDGRTVVNLGRRLHLETDDELHIEVHA